MSVPTPGWLSRFADLRPCDPDDPANWKRFDRFYRVVSVEVMRDSLSEATHERDLKLKDEKRETLTRSATAFVEGVLGVKTVIFESSAGVRDSITRSREWSRSVESSLSLELWVHTAYRRWHQRTARFTLELNRCCPAAQVESQYRLVAGKINAVALVRPGKIPARSASENPTRLCERIARPFRGCLRCRYRLDPFTTYRAEQQRYELVNPKDGTVWQQGATLWDVQSDRSRHSVR